MQAGKKFESFIKKYSNIEKYKRYRLKNRSDRGSLLKLSPYYNNLAKI
jgi:hypothetical protein